MIAALVLAALALVPSVHHPVTTSSASAQAAFDRGLLLYYAYNGDAAYDVFAQALQDDPHLAMAAWGQALAAGSDLNTGITPERFARAHDAAQRAVSLQVYASPRERAYINAIAERYAGTWDDRGSDAQRYLDAMQQVTANDARDDDAKALYAEALMELKVSDSKARDIVNGILAHNQQHVMANHLCIHAYDYAPDRSPGLVCADRVARWQLDPEEAHLAHMPSHAYIDNGRYDRAVQVSEAAWALRERSEAPLKYEQHDAYTGWSAAMMLGDLQAALRWAKRTGDAYGGSDTWITYARFGVFDPIHEPSKPQEFFAVLALGLADLHRNDVTGAKTLLARYQNVDADYRWILEGAVSEAQGRFSDAIAAYQLAASYQAREDVGEQLPLFPAGEFLAGAYLHHGDFSIAAQMYRATLARYPNDPRALFGLAQAQRHLGQAVDAAQTLKQFAAVWDATSPPDLGP